MRATTLQTEYLMRANQLNMSDRKMSTLLLDPLKYNPDTLDLSQDEEARDYWIDCFLQVAKTFSEKAAKSAVDDPTASGRAQRYLSDYNKLIGTFKQDTERQKHLTIRTLLEISDSCLRINGFVDPWLDDKHIENNASLGRFRDRLDYIDRLTGRERWLEIFRGVFAGNIFDSGAMEVVKIMETDASYGMDNALKQIQPRPWLIDGLDVWLDRIEGPAHKCALIFVDNSGADFILGIMPFARELLIRGTKVIFCANQEPSINDITQTELEAVLERCCQQCTIVQKAYNLEQLLVFCSGQTSVCLDLRNLSPELTDAIDTHQVDLLVIEGMARALHTNLNAKFKVETLKLVVVKNKWWANRLGGDTFSVICKYEPASRDMSTT